MKKELYMIVLTKNEVLDILSMLEKSQSNLAVLYAVKGRKQAFERGKQQIHFTTAEV